MGVAGDAGAVGVLVLASCAQGSLSSPLSPHLSNASGTVRLRGMGTGVMETILEFASVPLRKMGTLLLGFCGGLDSVFYLPCTV